MHAGVKLAALAAGINARGKIAKQRGIEFPASEARRQNSRVHAGEPRLQSAGKHLAGEALRGDLPKGKERLDSSSGELLFAVGADIFEKKIAEGNGLDFFFFCAGDGSGHRSFVVFVAAGPGN